MESSRNAPAAREAELFGKLEAVKKRAKDLATKLKPLLPGFTLEQLIRTMALFCSVRYEDHDFYLHILGEIPVQVRGITPELLTKCLSILGKLRLNEETYLELFSMEVMNLIRASRTTVRAPRRPPGRVVPADAAEIKAPAPPSKPRGPAPFTARMLVQIGNSLAQLSSKYATRFMDAYQEQLAMAVPSFTQEECELVTPALALSQLMPDTLRRAFLERCAEVDAGAPLPEPAANVAPDIDRYQKDSAELRRRSKSYQNLFILEASLRKETFAFFTSLPAEVRSYLERIHDRASTLPLPPQGPFAQQVGILLRRAQAELRVSRGRLLDSSGNMLDVCSTIEAAKLQDGASLTFHLNRVQVQASRCAFAAIRGDGSVFTFGLPGAGGDCSAVQDQLKNVHQIQASNYAFAAILGDGSVVTWGEARHGGDSRAVQDQLKNVQQIQATKDGSGDTGAFAAILEDGSVVTWGHAICGGDSSALRDQLKNVQHIQSSSRAFAAILRDGSVVSWGDESCGGDSSAVQELLKDVQQINASKSAFAAILGDGSVVTWGRADDHGGDSRAVQDQLKTVQQIQASCGAFAAILGDGSVVTWGGARHGGDSRAVQGQLKNVQQIQATKGGSGDIGAFAAILEDGSVVTWGDAICGGDSSAVRDQLKNVQHIQASSRAFAAILGDGSVVTWGDAAFGGESSAVQELLKDVQQIHASKSAFAAILGDGSAVTWKRRGHGGCWYSNRSYMPVQDHIESALDDGFHDGSVVTWGRVAFGGDSSSAHPQLQLKNLQQIQASSMGFAAITGDGSVVTVIS
ncbi:putative E3 ubiquitin-protein ligase HERC2 [Symbiodinium microadriaticum]|uniref:Putative E3 ubiquitin-protein ligase HERC2 n=1 Tax=Symbiodinium microadriaticum TaxID=2951 RepID=A0A1Q9EMF0_SYMMI|nr:putative E3 ubiquitin-protein ligase HERC2 [Symbiodinium microadriaticum]